MYRHLKSAEADFSTKKALFIKENMDLKDRLGLVEEKLQKETEAVTSLTGENEKLKEAYDADIATLREESASLVVKIKALEERPLIQQLREAAYREEDEKLQKFLEKVLYNIVLIKSGKSIELEPIVIAEKGTSDEEEERFDTTTRDDGGMTAIERTYDTSQGERGRILSVDSKHNLVVIDVGRKDNIAENQRCIIFKEGKKIASARIISVRYKVAAAFVDELKYQYDIFSIQEGDEVVVASR